jgi:excisionase family DNA binding protein
MCYYVLYYAQQLNSASRRSIMTTKEWFTVQEAAEYLSVSRRTVYKLTAEGRLTPFMLGKERHRRFRKQDLDVVPRLLNSTPAFTADTETTYLCTTTDPLLSELWDNPQDAIYDQP